MADKKSHKTRSAKAGRNTGVPDLTALYKKYRKKFSAADLQKYAEVEPMVPLDQVIADIKRLDRELMAKAKKNASRKRL